MRSSLGIVGSFVLALTVGFAVGCEAPAETPTGLDGGAYCPATVGPGPGAILYTSPGCGDHEPEPRCIGTMGGCADYACGCDGKVILGCTGFFEPYAYAYRCSSSVPCGGEPAPTVHSGDPCDPTVIP